MDLSGRAFIPEPTKPPKSSRVLFLQWEPNGPRFLAEDLLTQAQSRHLDQTQMATAVGFSWSEFVGNDLPRLNQAVLGLANEINSSLSATKATHAAEPPTDTNLADRGENGSKKNSQQARRLCRRDARRARRRPSRHLRGAGAPGDRAGRRRGEGQGRHRHRRRLGPPAGLHRLRRQGAPRRLRRSATSSPRPRPSRWPAPCARPMAAPASLRLYGNYGGDVMNFDMAGETVELETTSSSTTVLLADDVASAPPEEPRSAAASPAWSTPSRSPAPRAEEMADLAEVTRIAAEDRRRLPLDRHGADPMHGAAGRQADLRDRRRRDGNGHGHPRRARHLARQAPACRRHRRRDDGPPPRRHAARARRPRLDPGQLASARRRRRSSTSSTARRSARLEAAGADDRHAARRPLRHLDGDGRRDVHAHAGSTASSKGCLPAPCDCAFWNR